MNTIRDTISRIGRSARQIESFTNNVSTQKSKASKPRGHIPKTETKRDYKNVIPKQPNLIRRQSTHNDKELGTSAQTHLRDYQTKIYRDFLEPLGIPNLKVFNDDLPTYDDSSAKQNWMRKSNKHEINVFLLQDRMLFESMMSLLINITPDRLKGTSRDNDLSMIHLLNQHESESNRFQDSWPSEWFEEIPPMPVPLTKQSFQEYIYILTHSKFHYRNSSSLMTGLIPEILLYTHKLTNDEFKPYRSVHTYNYLIKFFGFDKHQSSFARELLLVMNKDGHKPNIDTINNLLKLCQIHSRIRSNTNTYSIITKYLKLCQSMNIEINLSTYNRIYDSINNIFLRESFLTKIQSIELPVSKNLMIKILDDFASTTKDTTELINFITEDLNHKQWHNDSKVLNKVIFHRGANLIPSSDGIDNGELEKLWKFIGERDITIDQFTLKGTLEAISKNKHLESNRVYLKLAVYVNMLPKLSEKLTISRIYKDIILQLIHSSETENLNAMCFLIRGLIFDATNGLKLPTEVTQYDNKKLSIPENYKIIRRIVGDSMDIIEARIEYYNRQNPTTIIPPLPTSEFTKEDERKWIGIKDALKFGADHKLSINAPPSVLEAIGIEPKGSAIEFPADIFPTYKKNQYQKYKGARTRGRLTKLSEGIDNYTRRQMRERSIYDSPQIPTATHGGSESTTYLVSESHQAA